MLTLQVKPLTPDIILPRYAHPGDAGMDVFANESVTIAPGARHAVATGFATAFDPEFVALVWDRSSMAVKSGIKTIAGVIDSGYRGEWKIALLNLSDTSYTVNKGDKIAQVIFQRFAQPEIQVAQSLEESSRGAGGFGSTGAGIVVE